MRNILQFGAGLVLAFVCGAPPLAAGAQTSQPAAAVSAADAIKEARALRSKSPTQALPLAEQAAAAARTAGQTAQEIEALLLVGELHTAVSKLDRAEQAFRQALERSTAAGDRRQMAESQFRIARTVSAVNRYQESVEHYLEAIRLAQASDDKEFAAWATTNLGMTHFVMRNREKAMELCKQAEAVLAQSSIKAHYAENLQHLGIVFTGDRQWGEALDYFRRSLAIREVSGERAPLVGALGNVALALNGLKRYAEALVPLERALTLVQGSEDPRLEPYLRVRRARVLQALGRLTEAEQDFTTALAVDRTLGNKRRLAGTLTALADLYRVMPGREQQSVDALKEVIDLNAKLYDEEAASRVSGLQAQFDAERRQKQIEILEKSNALAMAESRQQKQLQIAIAVVVLILAAGLTAVVLRYRAEARTARQLREALHRVQTLSGLLPICSNCKKIRNDKGYWQQVESYIGQHSGATFSHGICPDCVGQLYPEYAEPAQPAPPRSGNSSDAPR